MKALTICQPYAHLIMSGQKRVENRAWPTKYRGQFAIHAGKSRQWMRGYPESPDMPFGALVGVVDLVDCVDYYKYMEAFGSGYEVNPSWLDADEHAIGPYCFILDNVRPFNVPVPWIGKQGFFNVPDALFEIIA